MGIVSTLRTQRQGIARVIFLYGLSLAVLSFIAIQPYVEISILTRDSLAITEGKFYFGLLSNIGILIWAAASSVSFFAFGLLLRSNQPVRKNFFLHSSLLTLFLLLDDLFMMHEKVFPLYLNINEKLIVALYPISIICFLVYHYKQILNSPYLILFSSLCFLGLSMIIDILLPDNTPTGYLLEDGLKFIGIVGWSYYFLQIAFSTLKTNLRPVIALGQIVVSPRGVVKKRKRLPASPSEI